jgi:hypothetical protein
MHEPLTIKGVSVSGEIAIAIPTGTIAVDCDRAIASALSDALTDAASRLGVVLAAPANKYARQLPGKDAEGRTRYVVSGRAEGGRLLPAFNVHATNKRGRTTKS